MMAVGEEMPVVFNQVASSIFLSFSYAVTSPSEQVVLLETFRKESVSLQISDNSLAPCLLTWHLDN